MPTLDTHPANDSLPAIPTSPAQLPLAPVDLSVQRDLVERWLIWPDQQVALKQNAELTRDGYRAKSRYWMEYLERPTPSDRSADDLDVGAVMQWLWQVKRRLAGLPTQEELNTIRH